MLNNPAPGTYVAEFKYTMCRIVFDITNGANALVQLSDGSVWTLSPSGVDGVLTIEKQCGQYSYTISKKNFTSLSGNITVLDTATVVGILNGMTTMLSNRSIRSFITLSNPTTVLAATNKGIYKTTDGEKWVDLNNGLSNTNVWSLAVDPYNPNTIYAGTGGGGIYKSTDRGQSWTWLKDTGTIGLKYEWYKTNVTTDAQHPTNTAQMDALFTGPIMGSGIHKSTVWWHDSQSGWPRKPTYLPADSYAWQAYGSIYIPVSGIYYFRTNSDDASDLAIDGKIVTYWYGGHGIYPGVTYAGTSTPISLTAGWHDIRIRMEEGVGEDGIRALWKKPGDADYVDIPLSNLMTVADKTTQLNYADVRSIAIDVNGTIWAGTNGDWLWRNIDGNGIPGWNNLMHNQANRNFAILTTTSSIYVGTWGYGVVTNSLNVNCNGGCYWPVCGGLQKDVRQLVWVPGSNNTAFYATTAGSGIYKYTNNCSTVIDITNDLENRTLWGIAVDPANPSYIYVGSTGGVYFSKDGGNHWELIWEREIEIPALLVDPFDPTHKTIYIGTDGEGIVKITLD